MDWQSPEDAVPSTFVSEADRRLIAGAPPVTGAWRIGDPPGDRLFASLGPLELERGGALPAVTLAYETWGELNAAGDNAVLVLHALTGDSHVIGTAGPGHPTGGWWEGVVGAGGAIDPADWFIVAPNMLGGCQGSTGPASIAPDGREWGSRFPYLTIRDQVAAQRALADRLGIRTWALVIGGSMGGMQALEWAVETPDRVARVAVLAAPPVSGADQVAANTTQADVVQLDPAFDGGDYYDAPVGGGPHRGLALARRIALLSYRSPTELDDRFARSWQSGVSPLGGGGVFAVESYLDFHGNRFTRRFDANSYLVLLGAMSSHDIGRDRGGVRAALARVTARALVVGVDSDRLYPLAGQEAIADGLRTGLDDGSPVVLSSPFGHDAFLIERDAVGGEVRRLLAATV